MNTQKDTENRNWVAVDAIALTNRSIYFIPVIVINEVRFATINICILI